MDKFYKEYFNKLSVQFNAWLIGIQEDEPIPYEVNTACFIIKKESVLYSISYSGEETTGKLNKLLPNHYTPLEGQFFSNTILNDFDAIKTSEKEKKAFLLTLLKMLIVNFLKTEESWFLKDKKIAYGFYNKKPLYLD